MINAIEDAKPASILTSNWRGGFGTNTIFSPGHAAAILPFLVDCGNV